MQIDQAIEVLTIWKKGNCPPPLADEFNALNLGIEALKQVKSEREQRVGFWRDRLSGETKV